MLARVLADLGMVERAKLFADDPALRQWWDQIGYSIFRLQNAQYRKTVAEQAAKDLTAEQIYCLREAWGAPPQTGFEGF